MELFKFNQYIQLKHPSEGSWGYLVKGYEYINGELYLISGNSNIKHNINDLDDHYKEHIKNKIKEHTTNNND